MKKRLLSLLLALVMLVGMIPATSLTAFAAAADSVWVGGVEMTNGTYLANGATTTQTTKPSGGYAYYKDGTLTLNNYSYEGKGYHYNSEDDDYATVFTRYDLTVELVGTNTLTQTEDVSNVIYVWTADLTVDGNGKLIATSKGNGLYAIGNLTINGGTIEVTTGKSSIIANYDLTINGGNVTAISDNSYAIGGGTSLTIAKDLIIRASTTADGELGEYTLNNYHYKKIVITPKPEIQSVLVNGQSVADEGTFATNNRNVTIKTTYDSELSDALTAYGCKVEHLSDWYLNGQHINVAKATPVDQGDGTSTKTFTRPLNDGDVLKVYSWLAVIWPDGSRDTVDEHTVTVMNVDADFESISPVPTSTELTNKYTDLGTMDLGSAATNIDFKAFPKDLPAAAISDGWTTGRSISVTRDGVEIYNRTYADNELFGWNLKDNIDEGGTYLITLRVFAQKGEQIVEKTHKFRVFVKGSTIKTIALEGVGTPVIGKAPSTINTVKSNTDGVIVNKVVWTEYKQGDGGVWDWFNMSSGSKFESGKRYAVIVEFKHEDGYNFTANKADMTVYINGQKATVNAAYSSDAFGVTLEFDPITTPEFTTQPVGGEAPYGGTYTVNWATNFTPCKIVVGEYNSLNQVVNQVEYSNTTTSVELPANRYGYVVIAYYNDANAKYSNKITITEATPAFTTQPAGGTVGYNERHTVNWATNFDAVKQELVSYSSAGNVVQNQSLDAGAFQAGLSYMTGGYYYRIRAYYDSTSYIESDKIYVTPDQYFSPNPQHGNTEEDIIAGITYVPNGDGTFNAHVHVDVSCVDGQMLQQAWSGTGYRWYDTKGHSYYGSVGVDTNWLTFTLDNLGKNLEPGKEWEVKVYLADDYYADYEWQGYTFNYFTDTVPELKPEDIPSPEIYVGGVGMYDGDYLAVGATETTDTQPSGGYAYYKDGKLTLSNYSYEGKGYQYNSSKGYYAAIYAKNDLTLELIGNNTLIQTYSNSDMIYVDGANLTVGGDGKLTGTAHGYALYADKDITINGGTVEVSTYQTSIISYGDVIINGGDITAESDIKTAIYSKYDVTVNGGNVTAIGGSKAIGCDSFTVAEGMNIQTYVSDTNDFASATKWDGTTDISDYNCVWIVEESQSAELIKWVGTQLQATSNLDMQFALRVADLNGTTGNYIVLTRTYANGRADDVVTIPQENWTESNSFYIVAYSGLAAKEMGDAVSAVVYNANGQVISETRTESIESYALSMLGKITNAEQKTMFVDMLNYGAEAQKYFHYNESHLVNAGLTATQKSWATQEDIEVTDQRVKGANFFGSQLSLENVILLQMAFKVTPAEGMYAIASFTNHNGKKVEEKLAVTDNNGYAMISVNSLAIADYCTDVTVTLYNADGSVAGSATDSMASYVARSKTDLGKAIMKFGASAYAYFH